MAGIQVPKINRFEPQGPAPAGQNTVNLPDTSKAASVQTGAVLDVAAQQLKYFQAQEDAVIDTTSKDAANRYSIYLNEELNKARLQKGDPTQVYAQFTENLNAKYEEILNSNPNLTERGKQAVGQQLRDVATNYKIKSNTAYSGQYFDYDNEVTDSAIKIQSNDLPTVASFIDPGDEKSFEGMDKIIRNIGNLRKNQGEKFGAVTRDENGNQVTTKTIDLKIAKDVSDGLLSTIDILNADNKPELADAIYARYHSYLDTSKKDNVVKAIAGKKDKIEVARTVDEVKGMSVDSIDSYLNKKFKDRPDLKDKAFDEISSRSNKEKTIRDNQSAQATDRSISYVKNKVNEARKNGTVYDLSDMENDPILQKIMRPVTDHKDIKAIEQIIAAPKTTDPRVMTSFNEMLSSGKIRNMSAEELEKAKVGMNPSHRDKADNWWRRFNATDTLPQEKSVMDAMTRRLEKTMQDQKYVKTKTKYSPWGKEDEKKFNDMYIELGDNIDNFKHLSLTEAYKKVDEMVSRKVKGIITQDPDDEFIIKKNGSGLSKKIMTLSDRKQIFTTLKSAFKGRSPTDKEIQDEFNRRNQ